MERKENSALENQLQNEDVTVQRNKELFEYEMTEVKLRLAGRFKHVSAEDMKHAGADVVIREPNLQMGELKLFADGEVEFNYPQIVSVDPARLRATKIEEVKQVIPGITVGKTKKLTRTKSALQDVDVSLSGNFGEKAKVDYTLPKVGIVLEDISLPRTARVDRNQNEIDIPEISGFDSESGDRRLTYKISDPVVELDVPGIGHIKTADSAISAVETTISITSIDKPSGLRKIQIYADFKSPVMADEIKLKGLSSISIKTDAVNVSDIKLGSKKNAEVYRLDNPVPVQIDTIATPVMRRLLPKQNNNYTSPAKLIDDFSVAAAKIEFAPVEYTVECKCELPEKDSSLSRPSVNNPSVAISMDNTMSMKHFPEQRRNAEVDVSDTGTFSLPRNRTLQNESVDCADVKINPVALPDTALIEYKSPVVHDDIEIKSDGIAAITPKKCNVGQICVDSDTDHLTKISIKTRKTLAGINKPQVETAKMKVTSIAPVSDIVDKVQSISRDVLPKGLTYEEMCRRCVVPVRKLEYQMAFEDIRGTIIAELNS